MKQTNEMKQAAFEKLMQENGFERTGATAYDGTELFGRTFKQQYELAFYSSPKRAMNAIKEIIRCAGYAM